MLNELQPLHTALANIALHKQTHPSYIGFTGKHSGSPSPLRREGIIMVSLKQSFKNWRQYRNTCNELYQMSDHELNDIGIARGEIPFVARRAK